MAGGDRMKALTLAQAAILLGLDDEPRSRADCLFDLYDAAEAADFDVHQRNGHRAPLSTVTAWSPPLLAPPPPPPPAPRCDDCGYRLDHVGHLVTCGPEAVNAA